MDELEFEIGATDTGVQRSVRRSMQAPRGPRLGRPPRAVTVGLVVACVALVTAGLALASVPNLPGRLGVLLHGTPVPPTATPRIVPGGNLLYVENAATWAQLTLNGKSVAFDDLAATNGINSTPIVLSRGANTIEYRADPFPLLRCRVSVPASKTDTCPLDLTYTFPPVPTGLQHYSPRALDLTPTLDKLPPAARASLLQTISAYATVQSPATTMQPGERYVNADRQIVRADQPLTATFTQALATGASATSNGCAVLCMPAPDSNPYGAPATQPAPVADFVVDAHVTQGFAYTTASGQPVATDAPISANSAVPNDAVVALTVTWNGAWQVALNGAPRSSSLACLSGAQALQPYTYDARDQYQVYGIVAEIPAANPADGCLFRVIGDGAYAGVPPPTAYLHVLYRFGLLLVLNDANDASFAESSYSFVDVPLANAAETALALKLDATQPYS